jgi:protein involved in polysaccharide export with SLBB domain
MPEPLLPDYDTEFERLTFSSWIVMKYTAFGHIERLTTVWRRLRRDVCWVALLAAGLGLSAVAHAQSLALPPTTAVPGTELRIPGETQPSGASANVSAPLQANVSALDKTVRAEPEVFGANLFTGAFARQGNTSFNPEYVVAIGDQIQLRMWGAFEFDSVLMVDPKGNIFIPNAGPVPLQGVKNQDIQRVVEAAIARTFRNNVFSYASLAAAQPVRVFVGGFVKRPGLYAGTSMDSLLHYLDLAGGIDPDRGSFLTVSVQRGNIVRKQVNLYDFLLNGRMELVQLADGDVIFVQPRLPTVQVAGLANNPRRFEFSGSALTFDELLKLAKPKAQATHVRIVRAGGATREVEYFPLKEASTLTLTNGDEVEFTSDQLPGSITVRVEGEHEGAREYVLPYGSRLGALLKRLEFSDRSDKENLQLFRQSVRERQKGLLLASLRSLEAAALTARSGTGEEAALRRQEADLILRWVDRARLIQPTGQVVIGQAVSGLRDDLLLENGDVIRVPVRDGLILVSGEVLFPNSMAYESSLTVDDYLKRAGGYTQNADSARVIVAHRDGTFTEVVTERRLFARSASSMPLKPGDEVLVLPKIDVKSRQIALDLTRILYQIAITTRVVTGL